MICAPHYIAILSKQMPSIAERTSAGAKGYRQATEGCCYVTEGYRSVTEGYRHTAKGCRHVTERSRLVMEGVRHATERYRHGSNQLTKSMLLTYNLT
jgi:hypothetical protein